MNASSNLNQATPNSLGNNAIRSGKYEKAITYFITAIEENPRLSKIAANNILLAKGRLESENRHRTSKRVVYFLNDASDTAIESLKLKIQSTLNIIDLKIVNIGSKEGKCTAKKNQLNQSQNHIRYEARPIYELHKKLAEFVKKESKDIVLIDEDVSYSKELITLYVGIWSSAIITLKKNDAGEFRETSKVKRVYEPALTEDALRLLTETINKEKILYNRTSDTEKYIPRSASDIEQLAEPTSKSLENPILLRLESVSSKSATGWALSETQKNERIFLQVNLNDRPLHITDTHKQRSDVKKIYDGNGFYGFQAELNEYLDFDGQASITVLPINGFLAKNNQPEQHRKPLPQLHKGQHFNSINLRAKKLVKKYITRVEVKLDESEQFVSIIILNLNGVDVLQRCISSLITHTKCKFEIIIIDHNSNDGSIEYIKAINDSRVIPLLREKNYSFSASNNLGARHASGNILVFMNNDIIVTDDAISKMATICSQREFGLVGIKLWDMPSGLPAAISESLEVVQHIGVHFKDSHRTNSIEAYESRVPTFFEEKSGIYETPAVTAALMAISASDFEALKGFNEEYFYGQEDVDFCIKYLKAELGKTGVVLDHGAYHARGLSRRVLSLSGTGYLTRNREILQKEHAGWFKRKIRSTKLEKSGYWNPKPYSIAMIVSDISFETDKADYFTARELGDALELNEAVVVGYFDTTAKEIDINGYDTVIVFIDGFDPHRLINMSADTVLVGWARNWFDRWCERSWVHMYDLIFASSELARDYMSKRLQRYVNLLRIAASQACIENAKNNTKFKSDYCFTGSYFNSPREIAEQLKPHEIPYEFHLYGHNWENHDNFSEFTKGPVSYKEIPDVYASSKLVIDDANIATKQWGALNCRLYDSLATGTLCVTNNNIGIAEIFDEDYPTYKDNATLHNGLNRLLNDSHERETLSKKYKSIVLDSHTYPKRARQLVKNLINHSKLTRIAIKISAPSLSKSKTWGDLYFAQALAKYLEIEGYSVRIDCIDQWYAQRAQADDVSINLRGLSRYKVNPGHLNILWVISHPELICQDELKDFDKVFVASDLYAKKLKTFTGIEHIETLLQASDFDFTQLDAEKLENTPSHDVIFIGNSRNQYRDVVRWSVENNIPIAIFGQGWSQFVPDHCVVSEFIPNQDIPYFYNRSKVVLNDHWEDMKTNGFISNRVWDVLASGGNILTDYVTGINEIGSKQVFTYRDKEDFLQKIKLATEFANTPSEVLSASFRDRALKISGYIISRVHLHEDCSHPSS